MTPTSRLDAQHRADQIRVFDAELKRLQDDGVLSLSDEQQCAVAAHHATLLAQYAHAFDIDRDVEAKQLSLGMRIASFLGALALAASVFFLFYQFWGLFSATMQVAILVSAALGSFSATLWIQSKDATGYFTKLAALVAFACFVLNIALSSPFATTFARPQRPGMPSKVNVPIHGGRTGFSTEVSTSPFGSRPSRVRMPSIGDAAAHA